MYTGLPNFIHSREDIDGELQRMCLNITKGPDGDLEKLETLYINAQLYSRAKYIALLALES